MYSFGGSTSSASTARCRTNGCGSYGSHRQRRFDRALVAAVLAAKLLSREAHAEEVTTSDVTGNPDCWEGAFNYAACCDEALGPTGNILCWDGMHDYRSCCLGESAPLDFESMLQRGHSGDASVLPRIMQMLSAGGEQECSSTNVPAASRCAGTEFGPSAKTWSAFFETQAVSKYIRLQPFPVDADPNRIFGACCDSLDDEALEEVLLTMGKDCASGTAALVLSQIGSLEQKRGLPAARRAQLLAQRILESSGLAQDGDCRWRQQVNHAGFLHVDWFLSPVGHSASGLANSMSFSCGEADVRIFVDERAVSEPLRVNSVGCALRGLCFTEVWVHQFLRRAACRVWSPHEADFTYVPIYGACHGLDEPKPEHGEALEALMGQLVSESGPPLLFVFTCEKWKLRGWRRWLQLQSEQGKRREYLLAAVEAKPLLGAQEKAEMFASSASLNGESHAGGSLWHCEDCFRPGRDIVLPSAVLTIEAARLRIFNREPADRELLLVWRGQHAKSETREDVRQGYREVNETVRLSLIGNLSGFPDTDVGGQTMRYSFVMGNSHFCIVPRGRGWWTVRLFEAFYAGCVPVLLSDEVSLPFEDFLPWERFSVKWPMKKVGDGLYEHLRSLRDSPAKMELLHQGARQVACWFDFHAPTSEACSPYQGLLRELASRTGRGSSSASSSAARAFQKLDAGSPGTPPLTRFWF
ncbi:unnamed protein product [Polarella glacialis]|uniref:Exostosin GT47 domain-containing protein n=1 Tax=Polarella glacialis TaxID=89957 RepID=A0A813K7A6_POLGL|nr:unnamed protein product [Polarella glacialis]CAE8691866.1 unnamed protein product [Polarella glacialis]